MLVTGKFFWKGCHKRDIPRVRMFVKIFLRVLCSLQSLL